MVQAKVGVSQDGIWGPQTENAVRSFQSSHGLQVDGIVGQQTWSTMNQTPSQPTIQQGSQGPAVVTLQQHLGIPADGIFGLQTKTAVINFQKNHGLIADGIVGPQTWRALGL
jgi:murein L,D-transpeptidase YcbB/YkuD